MTILRRMLVCCIIVGFFVDGLVLAFARLRFSDVIGSDMFREALAISDYSMMTIMVCAIGLGLTYAKQVIEAIH